MEIVAMLKYFFLLMACLATSSLGSAVKQGTPTPENTLAAGLKLVYNTYQQCEEQTDLFGCLKVKALKVLHRALQTDSLRLADGMSLVKTEDGGRAMAQPIPEVEEEHLPQDPHKKQEMLDELLVDHVARFFKTHTLQFRMPKYITESVPEQEAGRKKDKGMGAALLMGLMMKGGLMAMAYKGVAVLAAKALMVAKIALVLAAVAGLSSLAGGGDGGKTTYEIVKHPHVSHAYSHSSSHVGPEHYGGGGDSHYEVSGGGGGGHGGGHHGWGRSLDTEFYPQLAAYNGQLPARDHHLNNDAQVKLAPRHQITIP